jgi:hypothetical protein
VRVDGDGHDLLRVLLTDHELVEVTHDRAGFQGFDEHETRP